MTKQEYLEYLHEKELERIEAEEYEFLEEENEIRWNNHLEEVELEEELKQQYLMEYLENNDKFEDYGYIRNKKGFIDYYE